MKTYNMCKKCPNGCCKTIVKDTINELWQRICNETDIREQIIMFGTASVDIRKIEKIFDDYRQ